MEKPHQPGVPNEGVRDKLSASARGQVMVPQMSQAMLPRSQVEVPGISQTMVPDKPGASATGQVVVTGMSHALVPQ